MLREKYGHRDLVQYEYGQGYKAQIPNIDMTRALYL